MKSVKRPSKSLIVNKALEFVYSAQARERELVLENKTLRQELDQHRAQLGLAPSSPVRSPAPMHTLDHCDASPPARPTPSFAQYDGSFSQVSPAEVKREELAYAMGASRHGREGSDDGSLHSASLSPPMSTAPTSRQASLTTAPATLPSPSCSYESEAAFQHFAVTTPPATGFGELSMGVSPLAMAYSPSQYQQTQQTISHAMYGSPTSLHAHSLPTQTLASFSASRSVQPIPLSLPLQLAHPPTAYTYPSAMNPSLLSQQHAALLSAQLQSREHALVYQRFLESQAAQAAQAQAQSTANETLLGMGLDAQGHDMLSGFEGGSYNFMN